MELISTLERKIKEMESELRKKGVIAVILFGSLARGNANSTSDVDIAVLFRRGLEPNADWIYQELQKTLRKEVDLVILNEAPPRIRFSALKGKVLYVSDEKEFVHFMARTYDDWADLEHLRRTIWRYAERWVTVGG